MKTYSTNYLVAVNWFGNHRVMCNNIAEIDPSVWDNMRFSLEDEEGEYREIYQWFITDCSDSDVELLEKWFGLLFSYSELLDCFVLCVDHYGTSWDYVSWSTSNEYAERKLGER